MPTKTRDHGTLKFFNASLEQGMTARLVILHSAAPHCLSDESLNRIMGEDPDERSAYLIGLAKIAQQVIRYSLYGQVINYISEKVLTPHDVHPSYDVKLHLGLTGYNSRKSFMDV